MKVVNMFCLHKIKLTLPYSKHSVCMQSKDYTQLSVFYVCNLGLFYNQVSIIITSVCIYCTCYIYICIIFPLGLIAGVVVAILVVVLLSLVVGMVAVVVVVKKRKMKTTGQPHSQAYLQDTIQDEEGHKDKMNMYQNVQTKPTPTSGNSEPYYSIPADDFVNPASATASYGANTYKYSNVDHRALGGDEGGLYEDAGVDVSRGGGGWQDKPVKDAQTASALLAMKGYELMHPEDLYAQPDKVAKVKKDNQGSKIEEAPALVEDLYTMPDMTKKMKQKNQKGLEQESEERKLPPQAPLPYKKHKEAKGDGEEDVPELPTAYDFDGEQDCDTGDGDGSERRFEYAMLDWQKK